jgi:threonine synthase
VKSYITHLECTYCGERYDHNQLMTTCFACGKVLYARYDLDGAKQEMTKDALKDRPWNLWRYFEIMPVIDPRNALTLGEAGTPLHDAPRLASEFGYDRLLIKDEGLNPTGSFKARGLGAAVSKALELGATQVAMPSAGNAAAAMTAYAARAGIQGIVAMPEDSPEVMQAECQMYGASVLLVKGLINDCGAIIRRGAEQNGWFDCSTLKEPYRQEGKKTMGIEIAELLGWRLPDAMIYPTGGGTGIVGMWKAFDELEKMGFIGSKRPKMIVVQAENCAPIVRAFEAGERFAARWEAASTRAAGIRVPAAIGDFLILDALRASDGTAVAVSEDAIDEHQLLAGRLGAGYVCPETAAVLAAVRLLRQQGSIEPGERVVAFDTGVGHKYPPPDALPQPAVLPADADDAALLAAAAAPAA